MRCTVIKSFCPPFNQPQRVQLFGGICPLRALFQNVRYQWKVQALVFLNYFLDCDDLNYIPLPTCQFVGIFAYRFCFGAHRRR